MALAALTLLLAAPAALAQWVWTDQNKQRHASDRPPPPEVPEKDILQKPRGLANVPAGITTAAASSASAPAAAASDAKPKSDPALEAKRRATEQEKKASEAAEQARANAARAENCSRARNYLQTLESGVRIVHTNPQGERAVLDDPAREQETQRTRDAVTKECR